MKKKKKKEKEKLYTIFSAYFHRWKEKVILFEKNLLVSN